MGFIYKITNSVNGMIYIGMTEKTIESRFKKHVSSIRTGHCTNLCNAMLDFGVSNFSIEEVATSESKSELIELEAKYIKEFNSLYPNGYNLTTAGNNCEMSEIAKKRLSDALKGREVTWGDKVGRSVKRLWGTDEYRAKQDASRRKVRGKYKPGIKRPAKVDIKKEEVARMMKSGMTINKIAKHFGVAFSTIKKRVQDD